MDNQTAQQVVQNQEDQPTFRSDNPKINYVLIGTIITVCFVVFGFGGYYLGKQTSESQKVTSETQNQPSPSLVPNFSNPVVSEYSVKQPVPTCTSIFSSKYLRMSFKYDSCVWKLSENLISPEAGIYSTITAKHNSNHLVVINANTMGMGGNYPGCSEVNDIFLLNNDIARIHMVKSPFSESPKYYHYLNAKHDYAIKGYAGKYGDYKFNEYFTFLNPEAFPNTNMCWRGGGINPVSVLQPKAGEAESYQINKDITVSIEEENVTDIEFLKAADAIAVGVYSSL